MFNELWTISSWHSYSDSGKSDLNSGEVPLGIPQLAMHDVHRVGCIISRRHVVELWTIRSWHSYDGRGNSDKNSVEIPPGIPATCTESVALSVVAVYCIEVIVCT